MKNRTLAHSDQSWADHLNEDQFIRAVADEKDLSETERSHLSECPLCRAKILEFEELLNNFTAMAKAFAPLPRKKIEINEPAGFLRYLRLQPLFAAGLLLMLLIGFWQIGIHQEENLAIIREMEKDEALMSEVIELEESPVPENLYPEIFAEPCGYFNDEFLEFVAPSEESRPVPRSAMPRTRLIYMSDGINSNR